MPYSIRGTLNRKYLRSVVWPRPLTEPDPAYSTLFKGQPLSSDDVARLSTTLMIGSSFKQTGSGLADVLGNSPYIVSEKVINLIEALQPNTHGGVPVSLQDERTGKTREGYYALHLPVHLDCIDVEKTDWFNGVGLAGAIGSAYIPRPGKPYALRAKSIKGFHIWRAKSPIEWKFFISDEFRELLRANLINGWDCERCIFV